MAVLTMLSLPFYFLPGNFIAEASLLSIVWFLVISKTSVPVKCQSHQMMCSIPSLACASGYYDRYLSI